MSEPQTKPYWAEVSVAVSSTSELHSLAAGIIIARVLARAGITYIQLGGGKMDAETISQAEAIPQSEMLFRVEVRSNT